jgi:N6-adenosine-specific RNA methylase IME4
MTDAEFEAWREDKAAQIERVQATAIMEVAALLAEVHQQHLYRRDEGGFTGWIERRLSMSERTAYNLLDVHRQFGGSECLQLLQTLPRRGLYLLAASSTPDEVRTEALDRAASGESLTHTEIKGMIETARARERDAWEQRVHTERLPGGPYYGMPAEAFEEMISDGRREPLRNAERRAVRNVEIAERRAAAANARIEGGTVEDLHALAASGFRAGAIMVDPPWPFATWSHCGLAGDAGQDNRAWRSRAVPYPTMPHEDIYALPVGDLAAEDCALFLWVVKAQLPEAVEAIRRWGFQFKSVAFAWVKGDDPDHVPMGTGYWTRSGMEQCWLATRGDPRRLHGDVREIISEPRREHSRKPDSVHERIERLVAGPYLELFARRPRPGWTTWGNEVAPPLIEAAE